jgi:signal transduction histidine kinase
VLNTQRHALHRQVNALDSVDNAVLLLCDVDEGEHAGSALLDLQGNWRLEGDEVVSRAGVGAKRGGAWQRWSEAARVVKEGSWYDTGTLPWVKEPVVWAASVLTAPDGGDEIVVAWEPVRAVREALLPVYSLIVGATLLVFAISMATALHSTRRVARVLDAFAESTARLAAGDYEVRLRPQPAREMDAVTVAINQLARDLRKTTTELVAEKARLTQLEGLQRQFVADASHELRSPLTSMRVTLEAWQDGVLQPAEYTGAISHLLGETTRLANLVTRLLDLSRIESGRQALVLHAARVEEMVSDAVQVFAGRPGPELTMDVPEGLPRVLADEEAVQRVLINLLENAYRYTPTEGRLCVWAQEETGGVRIGVSDTGVGIDPEFLPNIWNRFSREELARAAGAGGSGLGLAIVKALVEAMGGTVGVDSEPGAGTTVWFSLPVAPAKELAEAALAAPAEGE